MDCVTWSNKRSKKRFNLNIFAVVTLCKTVYVVIKSRAKMCLKTRRRFWNESHLYWGNEGKKLNAETIVEESHRGTLLTFSVTIAIADNVCFSMNTTTPMLFVKVKISSPLFLNGLVNCLRCVRASLGAFHLFTQQWTALLFVKMSSFGVPCQHDASSDRTNRRVIIENRRCTF